MPTEHLRGMVALSSAGPPGGGTESPAQAVVTACGAPTVGRQALDRVPYGLEEGKSYLGGCGLWGLAYGAPTGDDSPQRRRPFD